MLWLWMAPNCSVPLREISSGRRVSDGGESEGEKVLAWCETRQSNKMKVDADSPPMATNSMWTLSSSVCGEKKDRTVGSVAHWPRGFPRVWWFTLPLWQMCHSGFLLKVKRLRCVRPWCSILFEKAVKGRRENKQTDSKSESLTFMFDWQLRLEQHHNPKD